MLKMYTVVGARPQFIKAAAVSRALRSIGQKVGIRETIIHTGQHYDESMSASFFNTLDIPKPSINLEVNGGTHGNATGDMLKKLETLFLDAPPDIVLVYGDTNSTLAAALAASKLHIPVAHVEAGLRSFNKRMPEEINRILTDHVSSLLFCASKTSMANLAAENLHDRAFFTGDVMVDVARHYRDEGAPVDIETPFALATVHRAENTDDPVRLNGVMQTLLSYPGKILLPLHPRTRKALDKYNIELPENVLSVNPLSYLEMIWALNNTELVLTDSGGLQKEAYFFGKRCITLRDETEWVELVECGANELVGASSTRGQAAVHRAISSKPLAVDSEIYGNGMAAHRLLELIRESVDNDRISI